MKTRFSLSRRGLLQAGLLGSAAIMAGGLVWRATQRRPAPGSVQRLALSSTGEEILGAIIPVVLEDLLPTAKDAFQQALDEGLANLDYYLSHLTLPLQEEANDVFATLDLLPVRIIVTGTWSHWQEMSPETIATFLQSARDSRFGLLRRIYAFLQSLAVLAWFDQAAAWPEIGFPGPPLKRSVGREDPS